MLNGMIVVRKEKGYTSSDVVARLRGILHMKKIGHTGTLDPEAEGVLPVCLGNGTKLAELIADRDKEYRCVLRLGLTTDTQDLTEGAVILSDKTEDVKALTAAQAEAAILSFVGEYDQLPPMYSAVQVNGKRLYEYARKGEVIERKTRRVRISELEILSIDLPEVEFRVRCSKGTYIRTLCEDIGNKLGVGGAMRSLLRTRVGCFSLSMARTLGELEALQQEDEAEQGVSQRDPQFDPKRVKDLLIPVDAFFADSRAFAVTPAEDVKLMNGNSFHKNALLPVTQEVIVSRAAQEAAILARDPGIRTEEEKRLAEKRARLYDSEGVFRGLYRREGSFYKPEKMFPV